MAAELPRAADVVASRAKPPERREESDNLSEILVKFLVNNCHTASPDTTGKLTENIIYILSNKEKPFICYN